MTITVKFENVSKRYRLGLTRTSLPSLIASWPKRWLKRARTRTARSDVFWALRDVGFELRQGESLALVGANGAGKTTILKLLANITKPTSGAIAFNGRLAALIELGAGFHPDLTGRENVFLNGTILGLSRAEIAERFDEIVAFAEIEQFIDTPVKRYSSGMTVRLGFAVAACVQPAVLLVDEVLAVGDAAFQQKCIERIRTLIDGGTSMVFVSHNLWLVQAVCRTALYLERGQTKYLGDTQTAIELYEADVHQARARSFAAADGQRFEGETGLVDITRVEVWGPDGPATEGLSHAAPAQIRVHYNAYQALGRAHVVVFIIRSDGLTCSMVRSKHTGHALALEHGQGIVRLQLEPLQLSTGAYFAEAWLMDAEDVTAIVPAGCRSDWFSVQGRAMNYDNDSGVFEPQVRWEHDTVLLASPWLPKTYSNASGEIKP
jgi:lipopolysaccharide transport system ATP-binding protein